VQHAPLHFAIGVAGEDDDGQENIGAISAQVVRSRRRG
jgi:hypothetical protein